MGSPGSEHSRLKGVPPQAFGLLGARRGRWEGLPGVGQPFFSPCRSQCFSLASSVLLQVSGPLRVRGICGVQAGEGPRWDLGLCPPITLSICGHL